MVVEPTSKAEADRQGLLSLKVHIWRRFTTIRLLPVESAQITTVNKHRPPTLGIRSIAQGGEGDLTILVGYANATFRTQYTNALEWMVVNKDTAFSNGIPADPDGNAIGPFEPGATVKLRTRVTNSKGTTTGIARTLELAGR